jgi:pimeloyl-ACP methyl ester carboxylesterase
MPATVVLVHGAFHGAWCWDEVVPGLGAVGVPALAVDLPGHGASTEPLGDLHKHSDWLRERLALVDGPVVLVGHSYGGAVITDAAAGAPDVVHLVYLCAVVPDVGEPVASILPDAVRREETASDLDEALVRREDGTMSLLLEPAATAFYADCDAAVATRALARLGSQLSASFAQPVRAAAWREIPSTYVLCTDDRAINPAFQRAMAARTTEIVEWPTSHSPFLSRPDLVVALLVDLANSVDRPAALLEDS